MNSSELIIGICDNEAYWQNQIVELCKKSEAAEIHSISYQLFSSGEELLKNVLPLDILFLDEEMEKLSGQDIKEIYEQKNYDTMIIFVTSHSEILFDAFGKNVYGFLTKPVNSEDFSKLFHKLIQKRTNISYLDIHDSFTGKMSIPYHEITHIEAEGSYSRIYLPNLDTTLIRKGLGELENDITYEYLIKVHKSFIVNLNHCNSFQPASSILTLKNGISIPVARRRKALVGELYSKLCLEKANQRWNI